MIGGWNYEKADCFCTVSGDDGVPACRLRRTSGGTTDETSESANKVVRIGVYEPQTGDNGPGGKQEILGMQYANYVQPTVEIGGETYDVKLEIVDNRTTPENGPTAAAELVNRDVSIVLGSYGSGVFHGRRQGL